MVFDLFGEAPVRMRMGNADRELLYKAQGGRCNYCGKKLELAYMDVDHKTPVGRGSNRNSNLQMLCAPCNKRKGRSTDGQFRRRYKLPPAREATGPPSKVIPQKYFEGVSKTVAASKAKSNKRKDSDNRPWG